MSEFVPLIKECNPLKLFVHESTLVNIKYDIEMTYKIYEILYTASQNIENANFGCVSDVFTFWSVRHVRIY